MLKRTSYVNNVRVRALIISSSFEIGDSSYIHAFSRAIAVQRERELFFSNEQHFEDYPIFSVEIPFDPLTEELTYETTSINPFIKVNNINIIAFSTSSTLHIGNTKNVYLEARLKHIRDLLPRNKNES